MLRAAVLACLLGSGLAATLRPPHSRGQGRIVGGSPADISDYPWQLSLEYGGSHVCGASIISAAWAMTAAHCLYYYDATAISVRAGTSTRGSGGTVHSVSSGFYHENYDDLYKDYDIALLQALTPFSYSTELRPVSLAAAGFDPPAGLAATATGFGVTSSGGALPIGLRRVDVSVSARSACAAALGRGALTARMVCAGEAGRGFCSGDHGGPLVTAAGVQVGVASWGAAACERGPAVYAGVGSVRQWVADVTGA